MYVASYAYIFALVDPDHETDKAVAGKQGTYIILYKWISVGGTWYLHMYMYMYSKNLHHLKLTH